MMARTKRSRRYRVRVFPDSKTGLYQIEWREKAHRLTRSLKHRDWTRAKRQVDEFAAGFAGPEPLTLGTFFDIYGEEVTATKAERVRRRDRTALRPLQTDGVRFRSVNL